MTFLKLMTVFICFNEMVASAAKPDGEREVVDR
jgi:hypothetical protein